MAEDFWGEEMRERGEFSLPYAFFASRAFCGIRGGLGPKDSFGGGVNQPGKSPLHLIHPLKHLIQFFVRRTA